MKALIMSYLKPMNSGLFVMQCDTFPYWLQQFISAFCWFCKEDYDIFFGKNRGKEDNGVEKAITGRNKNFNDFINKLPK